jgi:hypothetical protein
MVTDEGRAMARASRARWLGSPSLHGILGHRCALMPLSVISTVIVSSPRP